MYSFDDSGNLCHPFSEGISSLNIIAMSLLNDAIGPSVVTSKRKIVYRKSNWRVHQFNIVSGEVLCTVAVLKMNGSLFLWIGGGARGKRELDEIALAMPSNAENGAGRAALATMLLGAGGSATAMARRLAALLSQPVYVSAGIEFDRFTLPLVERGLIAEIKKRPECF